MFIVCALVLYKNISQKQNEAQLSTNLDVYQNFWEPKKEF